MRDVLLRGEGLSKSFPVRGGLLGRSRASVAAVTGVSLELARGEVFGLVGESGCGKSTLGRLLLRLIEPTAGRVLFEGRDITALDSRALRPYRRRMQVIFQDPFSSLNPRKTVGSIVTEPLRLAGVGAAEASRRGQRMLEEVGLSPESAGLYPHEFSGGQRQRIGIARALVLRPSFLLADEPVSALDVSIQAQILNLLLELKERFSLTLLFVSHDLRVVRSLCDRTAVMYLGRLVETGPSRELSEEPLHPYTEALLAAVPEPDPALRRKGGELGGEVPSPLNPPPGCPFHPRCPIAEEVCRLRVPPLSARGGERSLACHLR